MDQKEAAAGYDTWHVCDECHKAIGIAQFKFDCQQCDNFTLCEKCFRRNTKHAHKFKKSKVPKTEGPPPNAEELIAQSYMLCTGCRECLLDPSKRVYVCRTCSPDIDETGEAIYWCKRCKESTDHDHPREKFKGLPGLVEEPEKKKDDGEEEGKGKKYLDSLL